MSKYIDKEETDLANEVALLKNKGINPELYILTDGKDERCNAYMRSKLKKAEKLGILATVKTFESTEELSELIAHCYMNKKCTILQKPIAKEYEVVYNSDDFAKHTDVDGFFTQERYFNKDWDVAPATPKGILNFILDSNGLDLDCRDKSLVIIGRGDLVGKPMSVMALPEFGSVTILTSKTPKEVRKFALMSADVVVLSSGVKGSVKSTELDQRKSVYIFNVGTILDDKGKLCMELDVDIENERHHISPRIGGVGILTVLSLMDSVINKYKEEE